MQLGLAELAFHAEQHPVVEVAGVIEAVFVADQRAAQGADLQQPVPVGVAAGEPGSIPGPGRSRPCPCPRRRPGAGTLPVGGGGAGLAWSTSMTMIWSLLQPNAIARPRRSYCRSVDSVLLRTCLMRGLADIQVGVAAQMRGTDLGGRAGGQRSSRGSGLPARGHRGHRRGGERHRRQDVDELAGGGRGQCRHGGRGRWCRRRGHGGDRGAARVRRHGHALAGEHASPRGTPRRVRAGRHDAVARSGHPARCRGRGDLAGGYRAGARFSSRGAR